MGGGGQISQSFVCTGVSPECDCGRALLASCWSVTLWQWWLSCCWCSTTDLCVPLCLCAVLLSAVSHWLPLASISSLIIPVCESHQPCPFHVFLPYVVFVGVCPKVGVVASINCFWLFCNVPVGKPFETVTLIKGKYAYIHTYIYMVLFHVAGFNPLVGVLLYPVLLSCTVSLSLSLLISLFYLASPQVWSSSTQLNCLNKRGPEEQWEAHTHSPSSLQHRLFGGFFFFSPIVFARHIFAHWDFVFLVRVGNFWWSIYQVLVLVQFCFTFWLLVGGRAGFAQPIVWLHQLLPHLLLCLAGIFSYYYFLSHFHYAFFSLNKYQ